MASQEQKFSGQNRTETGASHNGFDSEKNSDEKEPVLSPEEYVTALAYLIEKKEIPMVDIQETVDFLRTVFEKLKSDSEFNKNIETHASLIFEKLKSVDTVTGLPVRDAQNIFIKKQILARTQTGIDLETSTREVALIAFDVRGLKMVNDANGDHKEGDRYLKRIAEITQNELIPELKKIFGNQLEFSLARDGGDEFSLTLACPGIDFTADIEDKTIQTRIEQSPLFRKFYNETDKTKQTEHTLHDFIAQCMNWHFPRHYHEDLLSTETLQKFTQKGQEQNQSEISIPDGFSYPSYVAAGSASLYEVLAKPEESDSKHRVRESKPEIALNRIMGLLRSRADRRSYENKEAQNTKFKNSENPNEQFMLTILSRNDFTISIANELRATQEKMQKLYRHGEEVKQKYEKAEEALKNCLQEKKESPVQNNT